MFNSLKYAKLLEGVGLSRKQAETHIQIISDVIGGEMATKQDIKELKSEIRELEYRMTIKLGSFLIAAVTIALALAKVLF